MHSNDVLYPIYSKSMKRGKTHNACDVPITNYSDIRNANVCCMGSD